MASGVLDEIVSSNAYFASRSGVRDDSLVASFKTALVCSINAMKELCAAEATQINDAIKSSIYSSTDKDDLQKVVDCKVGCSAGKHQKKIIKVELNDKQFLRHIWNYPTDEDWCILLDTKKSFTAKASCLIHRLCLIGCSYPDEQTCKWALAVLLMCSYLELPSAKIRYEKLLEFKALVTSERVSFPELPWIANYPDNPASLPDTILKHAYEPGHAAVAKEWPGINAIGESIPLRKNSKLLKTSAEPALLKSDWDAIKDMMNTNKGDMASKNKCDTPMPSNSASDMKFSTWHGITDDPDELELLAQFQRKLMEIRSKSRVDDQKLTIGQTQSIASLPAKQPLHLHQSGTGKWTLTPRAIKAEVDTDANAEKPEAGKDTTDIASDASDALDEFHRASIQGIQARNDAKTGVIKRPAAADGHPVKRGRGRPSKAYTVVKKECEVDKKDIKKSMPKAFGGFAEPVRYNGGVIYYSEKLKAWRVMTTASDRYTEKKAKWGGDKPTKASWLAAVKLIDEANA